MGNIISVIMSLILVAITLPQLARIIQSGNERNRQSITSGELTDLIKSAQIYTDNHLNEIIASVPIGSTAEIPLGQLALIPNFANVNPYGQTWHIYFQQPSNGIVNALVTSQDGAIIALPVLNRIVSQSGNHAGYVGPDNVALGVDSQTAVGAAGGWRLPLNGTAINPGPGHLFAVATSSSKSKMNSDALYRDNVPNHPELNSMNANLDMNGNSINNVNNIQGNTEELKGRIGTNGLDPDNGLPQGWVGGVHTKDVYSEATIAAGPSGGPAKALINSNGDGSFSGNVKVWGNLNSNHVTIPGGNNLQIGQQSFYGDDNNAAVRTNNTFYIQHPDGSGAPEYVNSLETETGVKIHPMDVEGGECNYNGTISAQSDGSGNLLDCINGHWSSFTHSKFTYYVPPTNNKRYDYVYNNPVTGTTSCPANTNDVPVATLWYGNYGFTQLHICFN